DAEFAAEGGERFSRREAGAQIGAHQADVERELRPVVHSAELYQWVRLRPLDRLVHGALVLSGRVRRIKLKRRVISASYVEYLWIWMWTFLWRSLWRIHLLARRTRSPVVSPSTFAADASRAAISSKP